MAIGRKGLAAGWAAWRPMVLATLLLLARAPKIRAGETIDLYVDTRTGQVFTTPGEGRTKLGTFQRVDGPGAKPAEPAAPVAATEPPKPPAGEPAPPAKEPGDEAVVATVGKILKGKWYERISLRGYTQFRYNPLLEKEGDADWFMPTDRSVREDNTFFIRRARMIFSGDVTDHLYLYIQPDLNALPADGDFSVQLRDAYADVAVDKQSKEFRFRVGQSKVPYGWVNMQSSQNRMPLERPDALNSAVEGERDIGIFFYWAPAHIRTRFRELVRDGLKGSGDYGVFTLGGYSGQGLNRLDSNNALHWVTRLTYPFKFANGQIVEPGIGGYWGKFVSRTGEIDVDGRDVTPSAPGGGIGDRRLALSAVLYPQPFGLEAEWNVGQGPELTDDFRRIEKQFLEGGYVMGTYRWQFDYGVLLPFVRWQYYDGGRKFARNAPSVRTNEWDFGLEWSPIPEIELTTVYTYTPFRTNSSEPPYEEYRDASRLGLQLQWNY